ncbi:MAG: hypothetical protein EOM24_17770 [Chloroflexia bacterium]|nr:hypothetical protein [Chloroflexia bacterium]
MRESTTVEDLDHRARRGLDKAVMSRLATGQWIGEHLDRIIAGPTSIVSYTVPTRSI